MMIQTQTVHLKVVFIYDFSRFSRIKNSDSLENKKRSRYKNIKTRFLNNKKCEKVSLHLCIILIYIATPIVITIRGAWDLPVAYVHLITFVIRSSFDNLS